MAGIAGFQHRGMGESELLRRNYQKLSLQLAKAEEKLTEFREKLRDTRQELITKNRQLEVARGLVTRLGDERKLAELEADHAKSASKRLELKVLSSPDAGELQQKLLRYKAKLASVQQELHEAQMKVLIGDEAARRQAGEAEALKSALGLKTELADLSMDGQAQLLQSLAKSQEEAAGLALQITELQRQLNDAGDQLSSARNELARGMSMRGELELMLQDTRAAQAQAEHEALSLRNELHETQSTLRGTQLQLEQTHAGKRSAEDQAADLADRLRATMDKLAATERSSKSAVEALRTEVALAVERADARADAQRAAHGARETALQDTANGLRTQLLEMEARLSQSGRDHEVEVLRMHGRISALEAALDGSRMREASLEADARALRAEADRMAMQAGSLAADLAAARREVTASTERSEDASAAAEAERRARVSSQAAAEVAGARASAREETLAGEISRLRSEVAALTLVNERLQADVKLCQEQLSDAATKRAAGERHMDELHSTVHSLAAAKTKLQGTMLEQLSMFKAKLAQVEQENITLRSALATLDRRAQSLAALRESSSRERGSPGGLGLGAVTDAALAGYASRSPRSGVYGDGGGYGSVAGSSVHDF